jgi:hypothetical protein
MISAMLGIITILVPALSSLAPVLFNFLTSKDNNKLQLQLLDLQLKNSIVIAENNLEIQEIKAQTEQLDVESKLDGGKFINGLRASVRPVIAYSMFFLYCALKVVFIINAMEIGTPFLTVFPMIWGEGDNLILMAIISYFFSSRMIDKYTPTTMSPPKLEIKKVTKNKN